MMKTNIAAAIILLATAGCGHEMIAQPDNETLGTNVKAVSSAVTTAADSVADLDLYIRTTPGHSYSIAPLTTTQIEEYVYAAADMADLADTELSQVVSEVYDRYKNDEGLDGRLADGNFFVLWRMLFDVPKNTKVESMQFRAFHAGWVSHLTWTDSWGTDWFPSEFPLELDSMGRVSKIYHVAGYENSYSAAPDLDYMLSKHTRRTKSEVLALLP